MYVFAYLLENILSIPLWIAMAYLSLLVIYILYKGIIYPISLDMQQDLNPELLNPLHNNVMAKYSGIDVNSALAIIQPRFYRDPEYFLAGIIMAAFATGALVLAFDEAPNPAGWLGIAFLKISAPYCIMYAYASIMDLILTKCICIYSNRITKYWYLFGSLTILMRDATLVATTTPGNPKCTANIRGKQFLSGWPFRYIRYAQRAVAPDEMENFNRALAQVTGRNPEEFECPGRIRPLIKE